jgi:hypothetical protein
MWIYIIENKKNGKKYIGQTNNPMKRKSQHWYEAFKRGRKDKLHTAIREEGRENFVFRVIKEVSKLFVNIAERDYIKYYRCIEEGYNTKKG